MKLSVVIAKLLGVLGLALAALATVRPFVIGELVYSWSASGLLLGLQLLLSVLLLYVADQRQRGSDIAEKAYPAVIMALLLWVCMVLYWLRA
ncbi:MULTISPECIES: hypothetical protein [Spongiibacter]|uniref:hypothetical protein n=1 Tax=Spongiibacter TaxID=630749 RepID=UPI0003B3103F|nr:MULTISPECIES: hypothetical protein [Spongiibacter]MBO6752615.1 hypothetical protein [Spongiibacter sp.]|tara:strand:+ start:21047 stop:21322 length:276 start_codon:yes stop_codon:yes gene_type:complete